MSEAARTSLFGPALTAASVLISAAGLMWSWHQDRQIAIRSQAQQFRAAAADTIAALDRVENLSVLLFDEVQPALVEASERVAADSAIIPARDFLWKSINLEKLEVLRSLADDSPEDPVARLYAYHPSVYTWARESMRTQRRNL